MTTVNVGLSRKRSKDDPKYRHHKTEWKNVQHIGVPLDMDLVPFREFYDKLREILNEQGYADWSIEGWCPSSPVQARATN